MATFLFDKIIFGPVRSRRLGISLGINLLPLDSKICSFDCIYCECGRNPLKPERKNRFPTREEVKNALENRLADMQRDKRDPDVITFAGNGEPTLHPRFAEIIDDTLFLRDKYVPHARVAVLSNATMLHRRVVFNALLKIDDNIQKLDSANEETLRLLDCPGVGFNIDKVVGQLSAFKGKVIIQTMFVKGHYSGHLIDNTTHSEVNAWIGLLKKIKPSLVMIYTIARDTPTVGLEKVKTEELQLIAARVRVSGFTVQVSG